MKKKIIATLLATGSFALLSFASNTQNNLIKNGDFEKDSTGWRGDENIVFDTPAETNKICRIVIDKEEIIEFHQKIKTSKMTGLTIRFKMKKSIDYKGEGLQIKFERGDGSGSGMSRTLPYNNEWNDIEWNANGVVREESQIKVVFMVKPGQSGTLSFDDIEIVEYVKPVANISPANADEDRTSTDTNGREDETNEYRVLTDKNGREIEAKIIHIDSKGTKVTVQRKGSRTSTTVPVAVFNGQTQTYINSWLQRSDFLNEGRFSVEFRKKKKKVADKSTSGSSGISDSWSTMSVYYGHHIEMTIQNRSNISFEDINVEYTLFYTQEYANNGQTKSERHGTLYEKKDMSFPSKSKKEMETKQIILHSYSYNSTLGSSPNREGELEGIIIRLTLQTETGEMITREIVYPDTKKLSWTTKTTDIQQPIR